MKPEQIKHECRTVSKKATERIQRKLLYLNKEQCASDLYSLIKQRSRNAAQKAGER